MGAAGNIASPPEYFPLVREICTHYEVLLIGDEVQTGFGRTGRLWAQEHWGVKWDMMTVAKAIDGCYLPFGATLLSDEIYQGLKGAILWHGWTQHGNPICAAAAKAALKLIIRDKLVENAEAVGNYVLERLSRQFQPLPNVGDIGGKGLMLGIEVVRDKATKAPFEAATMSRWQREVLQRGLYVRLSLSRDYTRVRFNPPIITTTQEADEMLDILYQALVELGSG
jgi:adenosylmethionine-8-amino-7-oxononanoate aminotransferase